MGCEKTPRVGIVGETGREGKTGRKKRQSWAQRRKKGRRKKTEVGTEQENLFRGKAEMVKCYIKEAMEVMEVKVTVVVARESL
jgi:hypothetical protein